MASRVHEPVSTHARRDVDHGNDGTNSVLNSGSAEHRIRDTHSVNNDAILRCTSPDAVKVTAPGVHEQNGDNAATGSSAAEAGIGSRNSAAIAGVSTEDSACAADTGLQCNNRDRGVASANTAGSSPEKGADVPDGESTDSAGVRGAQASETTVPSSGGDTRTPGGSGSRSASSTTHHPSTVQESRDEEIDQDNSAESNSDQSVAGSDSGSDTSDAEEATAKRQKALDEREKKGAKSLTEGGGAKGGKAKNSTGKKTKEKKKETTNQKDKEKKGGGGKEKSGEGGKDGNGPKTASTFGEKVHNEDNDSPTDYEVPDAIPGKRYKEWVFNVHYEGDTPCLVYREGGKDFMSKVRNVWTKKYDREVFGPQWKRLCEELGLSELTYQGKDDPEGRRRWQELMSQPAKKKKSPSPKPVTPKKRALQRSKKQQLNEKMRQLHHQFSKNNDGEKSGRSIDTRSGDDAANVGGQNNVMKHGSSTLKDSGGDNLETGASGDDGDSPSGNDDSRSQVGNTSVIQRKKRRSATQGVVIKPTPFGLPKATHGHGCKHSGVLDLIGFNQKEYKHYIQEGRFLHNVGTCSGGCGTRFDGSYKARPMPSGFLVFGCPVGKRFCTKDKKEYDVECNFARCCLCQMKALEQHEKESGGGGRVSRRRGNQTG